MKTRTVCAVTVRENANPVGYCCWAFRSSSHSLGSVGQKSAERLRISSCLVYDGHFCTTAFSMGLIFQWRTVFLRLGPGGCRKHNFWTTRVKNRLKFIYSESWRRELSIGIYMCPIGGGGGLGGSRVTPLQSFTGSLLRNFKYIIGIISSSPVDWHPFGATWVKGGVCGHVQKSDAHVLGCRPRGESSQ